MLPPPTVFSSPLLMLDFAVYVSTPSFVPSRTGRGVGRGVGQGLLFSSGFLCLGVNVHAFGATACFGGGAISLPDVSNTLLQLHATQAVFDTQSAAAAVVCVCEGGGGVVYADS